LEAIVQRVRVWLLSAAVIIPFSSPASATPKFAVLATSYDGPNVGLVHAGVIYGATAFGGTGSGAIFQVVNGKFTEIYTFSGGADGKTPNPDLRMDFSGNLYGTTAMGGTGGGVVFRLDTNHNLTVLHDFGAGADGEQPRQGFVRMASGAAFGTTRVGTPTNDGNVWELTSAGTYKFVHQFLSGPDEGHCPYGGLVRDGYGNLYGTTWGGGSGGLPNGSVWKITPKGVLSTLYVFQNGNDGEWPDKAPTFDKLGNLYGTTHIQNGQNFAGAIWKIDTQGNPSVVHVLNGTSDGSIPNAPLVLTTDGNLYGTTAQGGLGYGTLFQISPAGVFTVIHTFTGGADGGKPAGSLAAGGKTIYGAAQNSVYSYHP
jgi:uncharacterized repeat protein (TIGR03803 family)